MTRAAATAPPGRLMSVEQAATYLGISTALVRKWIANRDLKRVELPAASGNGERARVVRVDARDLDSWIESLKT